MTFAPWKAFRESQFGALVSGSEGNVILLSSHDHETEMRQIPKKRIVPRTAPDLRLDQIWARCSTFILTSPARPGQIWSKIDSNLSQLPQITDLIRFWSNRWAVGRERGSASMISRLSRDDFCFFGQSRVLGVDRNLQGDSTGLDFWRRISWIGLSHHPKMGRMANPRFAKLVVELFAHLILIPYSIPPEAG